LYNISIYIYIYKWCEICIVINQLRTARPLLMTFFVSVWVIPLDGLDSQFDQVSPTRGGAQTVVLIFTLGIFVYKWLLLVIGEINIYYFNGCHWLSSRSGTSMRQIEFSHIDYQGVWVALTATSYTQKELNNQHFFKKCHFLRATKCMGSACF